MLTVGNPNPRFLRCFLLCNPLPSFRHPLQHCLISFSGGRPKFLTPRYQRTRRTLYVVMDEMNMRVRQEKVQKFEEFVDRRLKPNLVNAIAQRDKVFEKQKIFSDLKRNIVNLQKNNVTSIRSMVNLGSEVYAQAEVPETRHIFLDIGLGFHVEFTLPEALEFISVREARLAKQIDEYTYLIANTKAQIKLVCEGIRELLQLPAAE